MNIAGPPPRRQACYAIGHASGLVSFTPAWLLASLLVAGLSVGCGSAKVATKVPPSEASLPPAEVPGFREYDDVAPEFGGPVHVVQAGAAGAPSLVLIHGVGDHGARDFEPILATLAAHYHVLAFDLPAFARSTQAEDDYTPERYAKFIDGMVRAHFSEPVFVLGHSMGGALAALYASRFPTAVARLALLDVAGIVHYRAYARELMGLQLAGQSPAAEPLRGLSDTLFGMFAWPVGGLRLESLEFNESVRPALSPSGRAVFEFVRYDFGAALRAIRAPTWLGWGARDAVATQRTAETLRYLLRPRVDAVFAASGHVPMNSEPEALLASLLDFFAMPLAPESAPAPLDLARSGSCRGETGKVFEGDYDSIDIERCRAASLRHVRTRKLRIRSADVTLVDVDVVGDEAGPAVVTERAAIRWTGGRIWADTCLEVSGGELDLMGWSCIARGEPFLVRSSARIIASVSEVWRQATRSSLHGIHPLQARAR